MQRRWVEMNRKEGDTQTPLDADVIDCANVCQSLNKPPTGHCQCSPAQVEAFARSPPHFNPTRLSEPVAFLLIVLVLATSVRAPVSSAVEQWQRSPIANFKHGQCQIDLLRRHQMDAATSIRPTTTTSSSLERNHLHQRQSNNKNRLAS